MADWEGFLRGMQLFGSGLQEFGQPYLDAQAAKEAAIAQSEEWKRRQDFKFEQAKQLAEFKHSLKGGRRGGGGKSGGGGWDLGDILTTPSTTSSPTDVYQSETSPGVAGLGGVFVPAAEIATKSQINDDEYYLDPKKMGQALTNRNISGMTPDINRTLEIQRSLNKDYTDVPNPPKRLDPGVTLPGVPLVYKPGQTDVSKPAPAAQQNRVAKNLSGAYKKAIQAGDIATAEAIEQAIQSGKLSTLLKKKKTSTPSALKTNTSATPAPTGKAPKTVTTSLGTYIIED